VILLDEIEKAHPEVFNALLQILDDGRLTDGQGRVVDFKNTVVIMTSNVATAEIRHADIGFRGPRWGDAKTEQEGEDARRRARALASLKMAFRPEFLNRIDQIVVFSSLERDELRQIIDLLLAKVNDRLVEQGMALEYGDDLREYLMREGFDQEFGARPLRRAIQTHLDDALADAILAGGLLPGQTAVIRVEDDTVRVSATGEARLPVQSEPMRAA
jgi:ATP-dependent Clp protease ATP-binding subunit ClpC